MKSNTLNFIFDNLKYQSHNYQLMTTKNIWILVLLIIPLTLQLSDYYKQYQITPTLPPTAFIGQYYTVNFRVSGLSNPHFTFYSLPSCFTGSNTGAIQGTPDAVGSYNIRVNYRQGDDYGEQSVVLRVSDPDYSREISKVDGSYKKNINWVSLDVPSVYQVGDRISINLNEYARSNDYTWSYIQLPQMLAGDNSGRLVGSFYNEGYYSFGATCSNKEGNSIDYFFTFNIQPINNRGKYRIIYQVPNRNVFKYDLFQIEAMRNQARLNVEKAQKLVTAASISLGKAKGTVAATQSSQKMASIQVDVVEKVVKQALKQKGKEFNKVTQLQARRDKAQGNRALKKFAYNQAVKNTNNIQNILDSVTKLFNKLTEIFNLINQKFIDAQNQRSQAETDLSIARKNYVNANEDVKSSFQDVLNAKKLLQYANNNKSLIDFNVSAAFDQRGIANFQNDAANSQYNSAQKKVGKALQDLRTANSTVVQLQQAKSQAKNHLGQAQFNLLQAMNRLFVAQAAKEQSDKAILIASAQSSHLPIGETTTYIFSGCQIGNYPVISGTACVQKSSSLGYQLNSGYTLLFGDCTENVSVNVGDKVNFKGYLRDGYIHGLKIDKN